MEMDENIAIISETKERNKGYKAASNKHKEISVCARYVRVLCLWVAIIVVTATALVLGYGGYGESGTGSSGIEGDSGGGGGVPPALVCYYSTPAPGDARALQPRDLHPHLCSHINVAFARVVNNTIYIEPDQVQTIIEIVKLKLINPKLKILLSVGGAGDDDGFKNMVVNHALRKMFIKSIKYTLRNYTLDGIDLDWEFPEVHNEFAQLLSQVKLNKIKYGKKERQHFSQLLHEIRAEYIREKRNYLLTVAVAAPEPIVNVAYDVDQLDLYVDFVNIMTYDYHYFTNYTPFTGLNSPLYARPEERFYMATLNINYTISMYVEKGLSRSKIVVGIPTYGHTFTLVNPDNPAIGSPVSGVGSLGSRGFINYPDVCSFIQKYKSEVVVKLDESARVPYCYRDHEWISYDTPQSVVEKVKFIRSNGLKGAMIYSLNADDYVGKCNRATGDDTKFPLVQAARNSLINSGNTRKKHFGNIVVT